ncbi:acetolactate synthase [Roseomonas eburnea]|uniref:Acetolactate synthase n=1 Tax=Neoroseomonas eburnea TaxID=1346889 RepID=A0A9X9X950_9PROT|nr:thiamine pyrophosphate-dependent enzyme [Neoroseomonas eburnea]MBR0680236.1 acetolactate synthase [Neoroseomonas eburnea]
MTRTVGRILAESLAAHDVDLIYCVPGESYLGLTDALTDVPGIRLVVCRHEGGAGFMAAADGRMRDGRAGVALVSRGPGVTNAMIALHTAYHDATPLVMLIGHVERKDVGRLALQEQNYSRLLSDVTKGVFEVIQPIQASEVIARAFHLAQSGTPGPVAVILPEDIFDEPAEGPLVQPRALPLPGPRPEDLDRLAEMLANAERPLVLVGGAMATGGAAALADLNRLAEAWTLPISPTHRRPHLFDAHHPNYGGYMGIRVPRPLIEEMKKADLMVCLGERLSDSISQSYTFPAAPDPQLPLVQVWPDANEIGRVWRVDLPIAADPHAVIRGLLARNAPEASEARRRWVKGLNTIHRELLAPEWDRMEDGVNFAAVCAAMARHIPADAAVTSDAGNFSSFLHRYFPFRQTQMFLASNVGAMGSAVPMAVAAALRRPGKRAVAFVGDGGILMTGNEIATAMREGVAPVVILSDNSGYGTIGMHHEGRYPGRPYDQATRLVNPDFVAWAQSFGAAAFAIRTEEEIEPVLSEAFAVTDRPVVVHVKSSAVQASAWRKRTMPLPA